MEDLAFLRVDAVVRPAGAVLEPAASAAAQLDRQAGPHFAEQRRVARPLEAGAAVVTGAGELTASLVLHVVIRDAEASVRREVVRRALVSAWQRAREWGLRTIAAPPVGAGAGQLTLEDSAELLAETFAAARREEGPEELSIVVERESERALVEAVVRRHA